MQLLAANTAAPNCSSRNRFRKFEAHLKLDIATSRLFYKIWHAHANSRERERGGAKKRKKKKPNRAVQTGHNLLTHMLLHLGTESSTELSTL
jgi:hypothetical protein